jgi:hypothetical protein
MKLDAEHELSPQAIAALRDLLQEPDPPREEPSEEQLRAFALGNVSGAERAFVVSALVNSAPLRNRLLVLRRDLQSQSAAVFSVEVGRALGIDDQLADWEANAAWPTLQDRPAAPTLRATLSAIGRSLSLLLATPRYATVRRGAGATNLFADLDENGTLVVEAEIEGLADGEAVGLELIDPAGGAVRIDQTRAENAAARFVLPGFGTLTGLEEGSLPSSLFRLIQGGEAGEVSADRFLLAETDGEPAILTVSSPPVWEDGFLSVTLGIPAATFARLANQRLQLSANVGGVEVELESVPLTSFENGERPFRLPVPGSGEPRTVCGSLLQARFLSDGSERG